MASVMLVAFASFVLHGSAMARVAPCPPAKPAVAAEHHDHGDGTAHVHAAAHGAEDAHGTGDAPDHHGGKDLCCGSFCATAIPPCLATPAVSRTEARADVPTLEVTRHGILREALRKPPRTPDIA